MGIGMLYRLLLSTKHGPSYPHSQRKAAQLKGLLHAGLRMCKGCGHVLDSAMPALCPIWQSG